MRLRWTGLMVLLSIVAISCVTDSGPRFNSLRAKEQQQIQQQLESNWSQYIIYYIPQHAVLFDRKDDNNTLKVSGRWYKVADGEQKTWLEILRQNTQTSDSFLSVWLGSTTGFLEIIGPDEQPFGYLIHEKRDLVALRILDRNTMRIYYSPQMTEGR
ncbi:MAG: hypothetical protein JRF56_22365 [Deltaproteobacteria bacterium]|jgi:hypothetical protein|nr:hypothetical protein [Deltaproteobacteria bacterium]